MRVLITGVCGFVGSTLARAWLEGGARHTLIGIDNLIRPGSESNRQALRRLGVSVMHGDLRMASDFESLPAVDWVIDAAAKGLFVDVNVKIDELHTIRRLRRLANTATMAHDKMVMDENRSAAAIWAVSTGSVVHRHLQPGMGQKAAGWWSLAGSNR